MILSNARLRKTITLIIIPIFFLGILTSLFLYRIKTIDRNINTLINKLIEEPGRSKGQNKNALHSTAGILYNLRFPGTIHTYRCSLRLGTVGNRLRIWVALAWSSTCQARLWETVSFWQTYSATIRLLDGLMSFPGRLLWIWTSVTQFTILLPAWKGRQVV